MLNKQKKKKNRKMNKQAREIAGHQWLSALRTYSEGLFLKFDPPLPKVTKNIMEVSLFDSYPPVNVVLYAFRRKSFPRLL